MLTAGRFDTPPPMALQVFHPVMPEIVAQIVAGVMTGFARSGQVGVYGIATGREYGEPSFLRLHV
jgi:hypothetical protein